ncbi:MAG: sugar transferase [Burkholderiaceae bacterium]
MENQALEIGVILRVRPGFACDRIPHSVSSFRAFADGASLEDARRKHQFDLYYVKNNSLFLDLLVLIETVSVVLFREGQ